ncbi:MAG: hypothetical protein KDD61_15225 [Bdellovibrionales bacterium]|nr:hypothetical protein [Bdellovibrionales bacterium]
MAKITKWLLTSLIFMSFSVTVQVRGEESAPNMMDRLTAWFPSAFGKKERPKTPTQPTVTYQAASNPYLDQNRDEHLWKPSPRILKTLSREMEFPSSFQKFVTGNPIILAAALKEPPSSPNEARQKKELSLVLATMRIIQEGCDVESKEFHWGQVPNSLDSISQSLGGGLRSETDFFSSILSEVSSIRQSPELKHIHVNCPSIEEKGASPTQLVNTDTSSRKAGHK